MDKNSFKKIYQKEKLQLHVRNSDARSFYIISVSSFVGLAIAIAWTDLVSLFFDVLKEDFPVLSLFGGLIASVIVTAVALLIGLILVNRLETDLQKAEKMVDGAEFWRAIYFDADNNFFGKIRYFTLADLEKRVLKRVVINKLKKDGQDVELDIDSEDGIEKVLLSPVPKSEYEKEIETPMQEQEELKEDMLPKNKLFFQPKLATEPAEIPNEEGEK